MEIFRMNIGYFLILSILFCSGCAFLSNDHIAEGLSTETNQPTSAIDIIEATSTSTDVPTKIPLPTSTLTPEFTPTPTDIPWHQYTIEYGVEVSSSQIWIPLPYGIISASMRSLRIISLEPEPQSILEDLDGTRIAYWSFPNSNKRTVKIIYEVEITSLDQRLSDSPVIQEYDTTTDIYSRFTSSTLANQSDSYEIIDLANSIVGNESNPYLQAQLIHKWVVENIEYGDTSAPELRDALTTYYEKSGDCGNRANLFVALTRALGIPSRNVAGIHNPGQEFIVSARNSSGTLHNHVWVEFYIEGVGWIQADPGNINYFAEIPQHRLILSKGNEINVVQRCGIPERTWFHTPETREWCGCVDNEDDIWIEVKKTN